MFVAFTGQWLLWSGIAPQILFLALQIIPSILANVLVAFISNAGTDFCPGSVVGESATWAVALFAIAVTRPLIGGPN